MVQSKRYLVSKVKYEGEIEDTIKKAINSIGSFRNYIEEGTSVLIKPNYNSGDPPPATSDPIFIATLVKLLKNAGASEIFVGESSMFLLSTKSILSKTGLKDAVEAEGGKVLYFGDSGWKVVEVNEKHLKKIKLPNELFKVDNVIYCCCLKTHRFADYSISLKLGMGFVYPWSRIVWHLTGREEKIAELNKVLNPSLILMDARKAFIQGGPFRGEVVHPNMILASNDRVALDVEGVKIIQKYPNNSLQKNPWDYMQIKRSVELGIGSKSENDYKLINFVKEM